MIKTLLRLMYPPRCIFCRQMIDEDDEAYFCLACYTAIRSEVASRIKLSGYHIDEQLEKAEEKMQEEEVPKVVGVFPLLPYTGLYRKAVIRWKYAGIRKYAKGFARLIVDEMKLFDRLKIDLMLPVPLAPSRMRKRGFNQALDLARALNELTGVRYLPDCLQRIRDTIPQAKCTLQQRRKNVKGSMKCNNNKEIQKLPIKNLLLIDDIYTTGSTITECCRAIEQESVFKDARIYVLVICKGEI